MPAVQKIVDLSQRVNSKTQVYPGDPVPVFTPAATIDKDGYNILHVCMGSQSGTHADAPYLEKMGPGKIVLLHTGWSKYNGTDDYFSHPYLSVEAATAILATGVRMIGIDAINIDDTGTNEYPVHYAIVDHDGIIVENLTNLEAVDFAAPFLSLLPVKLTGADGAPIRAVAIKFA